MDESILREAGHRLYVTSRLKEMKRYLVFRARCRMHKDIMEDFLDFFAETPLRKGILKGTPAFIEQVTRAFFTKIRLTKNVRLSSKTTCCIWKNTLQSMRFRSFM